MGTKRLFGVVILYTKEREVRTAYSDRYKIGIMQGMDKEQAIEYAENWIQTHYSRPEQPVRHNKKLAYA